MHIEALRDYCLTVRGAEECMPFGEGVLVFKIVGKMFAFADIDLAPEEMQVGLKCDPERSIVLREQYAGIGRSHYGGENLHWNGVRLESDVPDALIRELVDHSVEEVLRKLPKKTREAYLSGK